MNAKLYKKALASTLVLLQMTAFSLPALGATNGMQNFIAKRNYGANQFVDIKEGQWYRDVVKSCYEMDLIAGRSGKHFDPQGKVTLAEAISFGARIHSTYHNNQNSQKAADTQKKWYDGAVAYAIEQGIIKADDFTSYERPATRGELAYILANIFPQEQWQAVREIKFLPDVNAATKNYDKIKLLYEAGVLNGNDIYGTFKCDTNISRAEIAAMINRVVVKDNRCRLPLVVLPNQGQNTQTPPVQEPTEQVPPTQQAPPAEQADTTMEAYAAEVLNLVNVERQKAGLNPLQGLANVAGAANIRAKELETKFSHTRPDGSSTFTVLDALNGNFRTMGENIAMGQRSPAEVMEDWMNSPGHKANILKANYTGLGVGVYQTASGTLCWAQLFVG